MPVYEYQCGSCQKVTEVQQRMADAPLAVCPKCGGKVRKLISMSSFQLKGGGWYTDGYSCACSDKGEKASENPATSACAGGSCSQCPAAG